MRKHILRFNGNRVNEEIHAEEIPIDAMATVFVSSEEPDHPIECAFDQERGPGGTRWVAGENGAQHIILAFDTPQAIGQVAIEIEEREVDRTQEMQLAVSKDGGMTYRELRRQEFNFSPDNTTFEREEWTISEQDVTHVRLWIKPDKGDKACRATLTSLSLRV
jgi:hypothetical protein